MLINVAIENCESDCRNREVLIEANDELDAANKLIEIAKSMCNEYEYSVIEDTTFGGDEYVFVYACDHKRDDEFGPWQTNIARIMKQKETPVEKVKEELMTTDMF